jgi:lipoprotein-releasing system permease protein
VNVSYFIAKRLASFKQKSFARYIIVLAAIATTLSVAVMIVALSFVNGFQQVVSNKVFNFWGQIKIQQNRENANITAEDYPVAINDSVVEQIKLNPNVKSVEKYALKSSILKYQTDIESVILKGVDRAYDFSKIQEFLVEGKWVDFTDSSYSKQINISRYCANQLKLKIGDSLIVYFFKEDGSKKARRLRIAGIFKTGIDEYDKNFGICDLRLIQRLNDWEPSQIGGYEIHVNNVNKLDSTATQLDGILPDEWYANNIKKIQPTLFDWLALQTQLKIILFIIMITIAVVNLITCLIILTLERTKMTGVLKAIGSTDTQIQQIFLLKTAWVAVFGIIAGTLLGIGICILQQQTGFIKLNEEAYYMSKAAAKIDWLQVLLVDVVTFLICIATLIIPTFLVKLVKPINALKFN